MPTNSRQQPHTGVQKKHDGEPLQRGLEETQHESHQRGEVGGLTEHEEKPQRWGPKEQEQAKEHPQRRGPEEQEEKKQ